MFECFFKRKKVDHSDDIHYISYEESSSKDEVNNDYMQLVIPEGSIPMKCPKCDMIVKKDDNKEMGVSDVTILKNTLVSRMKVKMTCPFCGTTSIHYFKFNKIIVSEVTNVMTGEKIEISSSKDSDNN